MEKSNSCEHELSYKTDKAANKIALWLWSLMQEPMIHFHLTFIANHCTYFLFLHFKWLQKADSIAKQPGFYSFDILVCYF